MLDSMAKLSLIVKYHSKIIDYCVKKMASFTPLAIFSNIFLFLTNSEIFFQSLEFDTMGL